MTALRQEVNNLERSVVVHELELAINRALFVFMKLRYTSIQMKCQGGVIFVHAPRLFYYPKRRIGYARCSLTGNKIYPAITKLTNTMKGYATSWHAVWPTKHARGQPYILSMSNVDR